MNLDRCFRLVENAVGRFGLCLRGTSVLTEAATGNYALTASIAASAGADRVLLLSRDSTYGSRADALRETLAVAEAWGLADRLHVLSGRDDPAIAGADIVTNLGFVRPIDRDFVARLQRGAVVPLMFEAWEYRPEDIDLEACEAAGIPVAGTDEHDPRLGIMDYLASVVLMLLFQVEVEVVRCRILVVGGGAFAPPVLAALRQIGADVHHFDPLTEYHLAADALRNLDAVIVLEHRTRICLIGDEASLTPRALSAASPGATIIHIAGGIDPVAVAACNLRLWPPSPAPAGYMSVRTDYVGPRPVIDLHAAGLKVGAALVSAVREAHAGYAAACAAAQECALVQPLRPVEQ